MKLNEYLNTKSPIVDRSHLIKPNGNTGFLAGIRLSIGLMAHQEKMHALILLFSMMVNALLNVASLSSIMPFVYFIVSPDPAVGNSISSKILQLLNLTNSITALFVLGGAVLILASCKVIYSIFHFRALDAFASNLEARISSDLLRKISEAPYSWLTTKNATVLRDVALGRSSEWARGTVRTLMQLTNDVFFLLFSLLIIIIASPKEGLVVITCATVFSIFILRLCKKSLLRYAEEKRIFARSAMLSATDAIMGGRDTRISDAGRLLTESFRSDQKKFHQAEIKGRVFSSLPRHISELVGISALIFLGLTLMVTNVPKSEASSLLILYALIVMRALPLLSQSVGSVAALYSHFPSIAELNTFAEELSHLTPRVKHSSLDIFEKWEKFELNNVSFIYEGASNPALSSISLKVNRGERIGVVGASGSGKSTLIDIVVGLLRPQIGEVVIDGISLKSELDRAWQKQIGYVTQSPFFVDGTLAENVMLGAMFSGEQDLHCLRALSAAGLEEFVQSLPEGIFTRSGDFGGKLSGGQKQRVAIARALYRNATFLIFDEATSALDSITEHNVIDAILNLGRDLTILIIAHRMSIIQRCDRIAVMDQGNLVAFGTHEQLSSQSQVYQRLTSAQHEIH